MKNYQDLLNELSEVKVLKGHRFSDIKLYFSKNRIFVGGLLDGKGDVRGCNSKGGLDVFIPTAKGFESSEWKKSDFYKMGKVELTEKLFNNLSLFIQENSPKYFIKKTGISVASVMAYHINSKVDYTKNETLR